MSEKKSIFLYDNYREYLRDYYHHAKSQNKNFSFRVFSRMAGFKAGNVLKFVMDGQRNLAPESIPKFAKALGLNKEETRFFRNLVLLNQAKTDDQKRIHAEEILASRLHRKVFPMKQIQYRLFAHWYLSVIREMVTVKGFKEDPEWIASQIYPPISTSEARIAVEELLKIGLLERDAKGKLIQGNPSIGTPDEVTAASVSLFHREMMKRAGESIERVARDKRELTALTFGVSLQTAKKLKELVQNFRQSVVEVITHDAGTHEAVYQLSCYLFPLVQEGNQ